MISASTDCSLRLWELNEADQTIRSFTGHMNEKNFVGLSVNCDASYIACGSENNSVITYFSKVSKPVVAHFFGNSIDKITVLFFKY